MHHFTIGKTEMDYIIVSRKDIRRLGRRYLVRGIDKTGAVANGGETEQIIIQYNENETKIATYVQLRGSIPLFWTQTPNLQYNPPIVVSTNDAENLEAGRKHFTELKKYYGKIKVVSLIDKKGRQNTLGQAFTKLVDDLNIEDLGYVWFDFHAECKKMRWENISKLIASLAEEIEQYDYFMALVENSHAKSFKGIEAKNIHIQCMQIGAIRTNCVDSLDRTGVVQSVIARNILHRQLQKLGLTEKTEINNSPFLPFECKQLETIFRNLWTDNGDQMSVLYSGTKALKTDFTRTGKRTYKGALMDGKHSLQRYYINQFQDGYNQVNDLFNYRIV